MKIDEIFNEKTEDVVFIELKEDIEYSRYLTKNLPYPLDKHLLLDKIKDNFGKGIDIKYILDGICLLLSSDKDFKYSEEYLELAENVTGDIKKYYSSVAIKLLQANDIKSLHYFRFLYLFCEYDKFAAYNYAKLLYNYFEKKNEESLRLESIRILEEILNKDENYPLAYYELANITRKEQHYSKAYLYYRKALQNVTDELVKDEIRQKMQEIEASAYLEWGIDALNRNDLKKAMEEFQKSKNFYDGAVANYYIGKVCSLLELIDDSIAHYQLALEKGGDFVELFQDYSIELCKKENYSKALDLLKIGLEKHEDNSYLLYNSLVIYIQIGMVDKAKECAETLLEYGDLPKDVQENTIMIKKAYNF